MSTLPDGTRDNTNVIINDDVVATAVQTQLNHISSFDRWLLQKIEAGEDHKRVVTSVRKRLDRYRQWILGDEDAPDRLSDAMEHWDLEAHVRPGRCTRIEVIGPVLSEEIRVEIVAKDEKEVEYLMGDEYLGYMIKVCKAFAQAQITMSYLLQNAKALKQESSELSQPADTTVQTHIRRLKEYNDIKDIGQQLIGLVAENRGVPVGTLYRDGEFGVGVDD